MFGNEKFAMKYLLILITLILSSPVNAHPHAWINMQTTFIGTHKNINKIKMQWQYDPMSSAYNLDGLDTSEAHLSSTLNQLAQQLIKNLLGVHYYTYLYHDKTPIRYLETDSAHFTYEKNRLTLSFQLTLEKPISLSTTPITLKIYEPTYYVDMSWKSSRDIHFSPQLQSHCHADIEQAKPTAEQMMYASSLPADVTPDRPLGQLFAQTVHLTCL